MLVKEITEMLVRLPDGAVINDRTRYDMGYMDATLNTFRARLLKMVYAKNNRINPVCYQKYYPEYEEFLQDNNCMVKFRHPEVISFDSLSDGFRYIGSLDYSVNYARIKSRAWLSTYNKNQITAVNNERRPSVLYDGNNQILEVYGLPLLKEIMTESVLANPLDSPFFNREKDQYPLNEDLIPDLINMVFMEQTSIEGSVQLTPDSTVLPNIKRKK